MFSHFSRYHERICKCMIAFSPKRAHPWKHLHWNLNLPAPMLPGGQWIGKETPGATMDPNSHDGTLAEWIWNRVKISNSGMSVWKAHQANDLEYSPKQSCLLLLFPTAPAPLHFLFYFFFFFFHLEANYFTILQWFLPYINMNQPWVYMCPRSWTPLLPPSPSHPSVHWLWVPCFTHQTWTSALFHVW